MRTTWRLLAITLAVFANSHQAPCQVFGYDIWLTNWSTAAGGNGHFYQLWVTRSGPSFGWSNALAIAAMEGGTLADITSQEENAFVFNFIRDKTNQHSTAWLRPSNRVSLGPWIGGYRMQTQPGSNTDFSWSSGEPFTYANWLLGDPNVNPTNASSYVHFIAFDISTADTWADAPGTTQLRAFIAEFESDPSQFRIRVARTSTNEIRISWQQRYYVNCSLQSAESLSSPTNWTTIADVTRTNSFTDRTLSRQKFYRMLGSR